MQPLSHVTHASDSRPVTAYASLMMARLVAFPVAMVAMFGGSVVAATPALTEVPAACDFTLTAPSVVDVSGTPTVTATLTPAACTGTANPKSSQICITVGDSVGQCVQANGYATAQAFLAPYTPGLTYTAKGSGCAGIATPSAAICSSVGPKSATL